MHYHSLYVSNIFFSYRNFGLLYFIPIVQALFAEISLGGGRTIPLTIDYMPNWSSYTLYSPKGFTYQVAIRDMEQQMLPGKECMIFDDPHIKIFDRQT